MRYGSSAVQPHGASKHTQRSPRQIERRSGKRGSGCRAAWNNIRPGRRLVRQYIRSVFSWLESFANTINLLRVGAVNSSHGFHALIDPASAYSEFGDKNFLKGVFSSSPPPTSPSPTHPPHTILQQAEPHLLSTPMLGRQAPPDLRTPNHTQNIHALFIKGASTRKILSTDLSEKFKILQVFMQSLTVTGSVLGIYLHVSGLAALLLFSLPRSGVSKLSKQKARLVSFRI